MTTVSASAGVILERIDQLRCDVGNLSGRFDALSAGVEQFKLTYTAEHIKLVDQAVSAHKRIDDHDRRLEAMEAVLRAEQLSAAEISHQVKQMKAILVWVGTAVGVLVITLIWEILTHQMQLVVP
jgi:outer membrane murein-binding lipoprotein Lpp